MQVLSRHLRRILPRETAERLKISAGKPAETLTWQDLPSGKLGSAVTGDVKYVVSCTEGAEAGVLSG